MRNRLYAVLPAIIIASFLASSNICWSDEAKEETDNTQAESEMEEFAAQEAAGEGQTEGEAVQDDIEESQADEEQASSSQSSLLQPSSTTGDTGYEQYYPSMEEQVEENLTALSQMTEEQVASQITTYNNQINLSVMDLANSMEDSSTLTEYDDSTMAYVKMLRNWYSVMDSCGAFVGVESYVADMTDNVLTMVLNADYEEAQTSDSNVVVTFIYDLEQGVSLLKWEVDEGIASSIRKAALNTLIGLGTVFIVLLFLTFIIGQIHWIPDMISRRQKEQEAALSAVPITAQEPSVPYKTAAIQTTTDDIELIAVISAAIAASEGLSSPNGFMVRSIRRRCRKSNWKA